MSFTQCVRAIDNGYRLAQGTPRPATPLRARRGARSGMTHIYVVIVAIADEEVRLGG
jgi:hypothetical protein